MLRGKYTKMCGKGFKPIAPAEIKEAIKEEKKAEVQTTQATKEERKRLFSAWTRF